MLLAYLLSGTAGLLFAASASSVEQQPSPADPYALLRAAAERTTSLFWTTDIEFRIVQLISGIPWLTELTSTFIGKTVKQISEELHLDSRPLDAHQIALEDGEYAYEGYIWDKWLELRVCALRDEAGEVTGTAGVLQDITRRRRAEDDLRRTRLELEERVERRTSELAEANEQLKGLLQRSQRAEQQLRRSEQLYRGLVESQEAMIVRVDPKGRFRFVNEAYCHKFGKSFNELIGEKFQPLVHEDDLARTLEAMEKLYEPPYRVTVEQRARTVEGWRWLQWEDVAMLDDEGNVIEIQAIGRDITAQMEAREAERDQYNFTEALIDTAAALNSTLNLDEVLDRILANVRRVVDHDTANIMLVEEGGLVHIVRARGYDSHTSVDEVIALTFFIQDAPLYKQIMVTGEALLLNDVTQSEAWLLLHPGLSWIRSFLCAPIRVESEVIGFLNLDSADVNAFDERHATRLTAFADQAGIAIRNARLYQQAQELAVMEERNTIARDLHDSVNQTLFSANVIAQTLPRLMDEDPELVRQNMVELAHLTGGALAEMRALLMELRPQELQRARVEDLLRQLVKSFAGRTPASISLEVDGQCDLPVEPRIMIYRIAQEALNNISRHARPDRVSVVLRCRGQGVQLEIHDDGRGFDAAEVDFGSFGLQIMRERAESIGAALAVRSTPGSGTTVTINWEPDENHDE